MKFFILYIFVILLPVLFVYPGSTHAQTVSLSVTPHTQEHSLSCEIATLKMALGEQGIDVSEHELISRLSFDATPKNNGVWGDPNKGFVGNIDGRMLVDGYGVYAKPIADVGSKYAQTTVLTNASIQQLAREVVKGNPVIIWGYYGSNQTFFSWKTPAGNTVKAVDGEHTYLVYGFDGTPSVPTRFYLVDPANGERISWSAEELVRVWSSLDFMAVVVVPHPTWMRVSGETEVWEIDAIRKTRRWITNWETFVRRGGSAASIVSVSLAELLRYTIGLPIE